MKNAHVLALLLLINFPSPSHASLIQKCKNLLTVLVFPELLYSHLPSWARRQWNRRQQLPRIYAAIAKAEREIEYYRSFYGGLTRAEWARQLVESEGIEALRIRVARLQRSYGIEMEVTEMEVDKSRENVEQLASLMPEDWWIAFQIKEAQERIASNQLEIAELSGPMRSNE